VHQLPSQADFSVFSEVADALAGVEGIELTRSCSNRSPGATGLIWEYQKTFDARMSARRQNASSQRATQLDIIR
jgi:hypothetical protein